MATKQDKSKSSPDQNQSTDTAARSARSSDTVDPAHSALPDAVAEAIDAERAKLLQAHAVLKCLQQVLEYAEDDDAQYCADSAEMIAKVIDDSIAQLDPTRLRRLVKAPKGGYEVREPMLPYHGSADGRSHASLRLVDAPIEYNAA